MASARRKNISTVPSAQAWRRPARLPLTGREMQTELKALKRWKPTKLDEMLDDDEARVLELWAENEMFLNGRVASSSFSDARSSGRSDISPIPDSRIEQVKRHMRMKISLHGNSVLEILSCFTAMQNRHEDALSAGQYGLIYCQSSRNKGYAFLTMIQNAASEIAKMQI